MDNIYIIIGLGNPGNRYNNTRHNVGFDTVDLLSGKHGIKVSKVKHKAIVGDGQIGGERVLLVKPQTFMNLSGECVLEVVEWYKAPLHKVIVIYDDVDLPAAKLRVRPGGSSGTHNGMRSVLYHLQSEDFPRVRIGIGRPPEGWDMADFVLSRFSPEERKVMEDCVRSAAEAVEAIVTSGVEAAMNKFNK